MSDARLKVSVSPQLSAVEAPTVLIVDDQRSILITLEFILAGSFRVLTAESGERGVALAVSQQIDGAIVDLHMPGMKGVETSKRLRALAFTAGRAMPVWLMSAAAGAEANRLVAEAGAVELLPKPFPPDLLDRLRCGLQNIAGQGAPVPT